LADYYGGQRTQFLYNTTSLSTAGIPTGALITQIGWVANATTISGHLIEGFSIKLSNTSTNSLSSSLESGSTEVYAPQNYSYTSGTSGNILFTLDNYFVYNGTGLLVDVCYGSNVTASTSNPAIQYEQVSYNASSYYRANNINGCLFSNYTQTTSTKRPLLLVTYVVPPICSSLPDAPIASLTGDSVFCAGITKTMNATGFSISSELSTQWKVSNTSEGPYSNVTVGNGANTISYTTPSLNAGSYYYVCTSTCNATGQTAISNEIELTVYPPPSLSFISQPVSTQYICVGGSSVPLTVSLAPGNGFSNYSFQWYSNTSATNTGGTIITNANSATYNPTTFNVAGSFYYYCVATAENNCGSINSQVASVFVAADPTIITQPNSSQNVCLGNTSPTLSISIQNTTGTLSYQWYNLLGNTPVLNQNQAFFNPGIINTSGTFQYYVIVNQTGSGCNILTSNIASINVGSNSSTATATPTSQVQCIGNTPIPLVATYTQCSTCAVGSPVYQWYGQYGTPISGATSSSYSPPSQTSTGNYNYQCRITFPASGCVIYANSTISFTSTNILYGQSVNSQIICSGQIANTLLYNYGNGPSYQWYSNSVNNTASGIAIQGATTSSYTPPSNLVGNIYYYCVANYGGVCGAYTSSIASINVKESPVIISQPNLSQSACAGGSSSPLSVVAENPSSTGVLTFQWYSNSVNNTNTGFAISNATSAIYVPPTTSIGSAYYYCVVSNSNGCSVASVASEVIVYPPLNTTIEPSTTNVCMGGTTNEICVNYSNPTGTGAPSYQWFSNSINSNLGGTVINAATSNCFSPPSSTAGITFYYAIITLTSGGCPSNVTNTAEVIVTTDPIIAVQPTPSQTICAGGSSDPLTVTLQNDTGIGTFSYQWYSNVQSNNSGGTPIIGADSSTYMPQVFNLPGAFYYYCVVSNTGNGCDNVVTDIASIFVVNDPYISAPALNIQTLCQTGAATPLTLTPSGGSGTFLYQWYRNSNNSSYSGILISDENTTTYTPSTSVIDTSYYYCIVSTTSSGCLVTSEISTVVVAPQPTFTSEPEPSNVCVGGTNNQLCVTYSDGSGDPIYQWYRNSINSNVGGTLVSSAISNCYTPPSTVAGTNYYYASLDLTGQGCSIIKSNTAEVTVSQDPIITQQPTATQSFCVGGSANLISIIATGGVGEFTYQWYNSLDNSEIPGANSSSFDPGISNTASEKSYYVQINQSGSGCNSLTSNASIVIAIEDAVLSSISPAYQIICEQSQIDSLSISVNGGAQLFYQWFNAPNSTAIGNPIANAISPVFTPPTNAVSNTFYYCQLTSTGSGCTPLMNSELFQVEIVPQPQITTEAYNTGACIGNTIPTYQISGNYDIEGNVHFFQSNLLNSYDGAELSTLNFTPTSNSIGNYSYYFIYSVDYPGCLADTSDFYNVTITDIPVLSLGSNEAIVGCSGAEIELTNFVVPNLNSHYILVWNIDNGTNDTINSTNVYIAPPINTLGSHSMHIQMLSSYEYCSTSDELMLSIEILADAVITEEQNFNQTICSFDEAINAPLVLIEFDSLIGTPNYQWYEVLQSNLIEITNANQNSYLPQFPMTGIFKSKCVIEFNYPGCELTSSISTLTFDENNLDCYPELVIPEAISPNNDGMNDFWTIIGIELFNGYEINIFNSFGQSIYFIKNTPPNWDGTWNGQTLMSGDYFYALKLNELNRTLFGTVSILK